MKDLMAGGRVWWVILILAIVAGVFLFTGCASKTVVVGSPVEDVRKILGEPERVSELDDETWYHYSGMIVIVRHNVVVSLGKKRDRAGI